MKWINRKIKAKKAKQQEKALKSVQQLIPIKEIEQGKLITPDNKMVQCLKVSAINLELTSNAECNELFELFEGFLMTITYPVQLTNVSMPVDLKSYISEQERTHFLTKNPYKRQMQESYIEYAKEIEISQDIMQRQRYVIFCEQMKEDTPEIRYETILELEEKKDEIVTSLLELELTAEEVTDLELIRYLHTLFDYNEAQNRPIESSTISQIIQGGKEDVQTTGSD